MRGVETPQQPEVINAAVLQGKLNSHKPSHQRGTGPEETARDSGGGRGIGGWVQRSWKSCGCSLAFSVAE